MHKKQQNERRCLESHIDFTVFLQGYTYCFQSQIISICRSTPSQYLSRCLHNENRYSETTIELKKPTPDVVYEVAYYFGF